MNELISSMLVRTSRSRCSTLRAGNLEGIDGVCQCRFPNGRPQRVTLDQVNAWMEHFLEIMLDTNEVVDTEVKRVVEHDEYVHIALGTGVAARQRAENAGMNHAHGGEFSAMSAQDFQRPIEPSARPVSPWSSRCRRLGLYLREPGFVLSDSHNTNIAYAAAPLPTIAQRPSSP